MSDPRRQPVRSSSLDRRRLLGTAAGAAAALAVGASVSPSVRAQDATPAAGNLTGINPDTWNPDTIQAMAGTETVDTASEMHALVPAETAGELSWWAAGPNQASPVIATQLWEEFQTTFQTYWPSIGLDVQNVDYNELLDKARVAAAGGASPSVAKFPILWGVEFAARGLLQEITLEDYGLTAEQFWPGALKSVTWEGKYYGIPTNNETMAFIYNRDIFQRAGLDPDNPPQTWDDVRTASKTITDALGGRVKGYGMVAKQNAGNTPFRFMPMLWAYGGSALDEADDNPTYATTKINTPEGVRALQLMYDMYVTDRSVPTSALTNTQVENQDLFLTEQIAMMISHPSEYVALRNKIDGLSNDEEKQRATSVVDNMEYVLIPEGPVRRAVVFGGSNAHIFTDEAHGGVVDANAAKAMAGLLTSPEWSLKNNWTDSNPANLRGFRTDWMRERLDTIRFLDVTTSMLPYGIPFPVVPESTEIMNSIVPDMLQNALTEAMSVQEAADDAAAKINELIAQRAG